MWISKKKWNALEEKVAALEEKLKEPQVIDLKFRMPEGYTNDLIVKKHHELMFKKNLTR
ncbi:hypothetical protein IMSAGC020_00923 [Lachnospiraceae bacterium]|nr:hypothetical protein IMSAGC020_00923 [Lachnospiraceae bacterium]